jgi:hypothetical protein
MATPTPQGTTYNNTTTRQFSADVHHLVQQSVAKMTPFIKLKQLKAADLAYDRLGSVDMREITGRFVAVEFDDPAFSRRQLSNRRFVLSLPIDDKDDIEAKLEWDTEFKKMIAKAIVRQKDRIAIEAAFATVNTGPQFATPVTAVADGVLNVNCVVSGGINYDKLLEVTQNFIDREVDPADHLMGLTVGGREHTDLMQENQLTSGDFNREYFIEKGSMVKAAGLELLKYGALVTNPMFPTILVANPLNISGSNEKQHIAIAQGGICVGLAKDFEIKVYDDHRYYGTRVIEVSAQMGAVRTEGALVQRVVTPA